MIADKYEKKFNSSNKVSDIIKYISSITHVTSFDIRVFDSEKNSLLESNSFLFNIFKKNDKNHAYAIRSEKVVKITFQNNGKFFDQLLWPSMNIKEVLEVLKIQGKIIKDDTFIIFMGRVLDMESTLLSVIGNNDDDISPLTIETKMPEHFDVQLMSETENYGKFEFIEGASGFDVHFLASILTGQDFDSICLKYKDDEFNDDDLIERDISFYIINKYLLEKDKDSESEHLDEPEEEYDESSIFDKWNGVISPSKNDPKNEYIFKFKITSGDFIELQLPKDVTVKEVKERFAEKEEVEPCSVTIFLENVRLADFLRLTDIEIPEGTSFFKVRIYDINKELNKKIRGLGFK